jgi:hypothetical protein
MDYGSVCGSHRCLSPRLEENTVVGQPSLDTDTSYSSESYKGKSISNDSSSLLEVSTMVPTSDQSPSGTSDNSQRTGNVFTDSPTPTTSYTEPKVEDTRVQHIRAWYESKGFSKKSINLLVSTLDKNSTQMVSSNIRTWLSWCELHLCNPITCPVNKICDFFVDMLAKELSFNTIAGYRTAISEIHEHIDDAPIGSHPDIS